MTLLTSKTLPTLLVLLITLSITSQSLAYGLQHGGTKHGGPRHELNLVMLEHALALSEQQVSQIQAIRDKNRVPNQRQVKGNIHQKVMSLDPSSADYQTQVELIANQQAERVKQKVLRRAAIHAEVYTVLNSEQQDKLNEIKQNMRKNNGERFRQ